MQGRTVFAFRMDFDEDLLGPHDLDHLTHVRAWLLQEAELFS